MPSAGGSIILELLIASAVLSLTLTSAILAMGSGATRALSQDFDVSSLAEWGLAEAAYNAGVDYPSLISRTESKRANNVDYVLTRLVDDITPCVKEVSVRIAPQTGAGMQEVMLTGRYTDIVGARAVGGDCESWRVAEEWDGIQIVDTVSAPGASGTAIDVLGSTAYLRISELPFFGIYENGAFTTDFTNDFALPTYPNALDAISFPDDNGYFHRYVFAAMHAATDQFAVLEVTDANAPVVLASLTLSGVNSLGADPQAYNVRYFSGMVYVTTRYISGPQPELHIIDVSNPSHPIEVTSVNIETTINDMVVHAQAIQGDVRHFLFAATTHNEKELLVLDVTDPYSVSATPSATVNIPGIQDGESLALVSQRLYFGRQSVPGGDDVHVFDISDLTTDPVQVASTDIGTSVTSIHSIGTLLFLGTSKSGRQAQVWAMDADGSLSLQSYMTVPGLVEGGVEYADNRLYAAGTNALIIFESN